jgi:hypothetical protein
MLYYFAYGSNMDAKQMRDCCPNSTRVGIGILQDYKIGFSRFSSGRDSAVADVLMSSGDCVWGIIYKTTDEDLARLDVYEGHPNVYRRRTETCLKFNRPKRDWDSEDENDESNTGYNEFNDLNNYEKMEVEVYEVVNKSSNLFPKIEYLRLMLDASFENFFPGDYYNQLLKFGVKDYQEKLRVICDEFLELQVKIEANMISKLAKRAEEWGGANLVVTGSPERKNQLNRDYPHDLVVLTSHWKELSWLVKDIYKNPKISWQVDASNKHYFLGEMGMAMLEYQGQHPADFDPRGILHATLASAYKTITSDFYKMY